MICINKTVFIATLIIVFLAGLYGGYRIEKQKLDRMMAVKDSAYTQQLTNLSSQNMKLSHDMMMSKDHMTMSDNKMMVVGADGTSSVMKVNASIANDGKVTTDGTVVKKDGTSMKLSNGMSVWPDGTVMNSDGSLMTK